MKKIFYLIPVLFMLTAYTEVQRIKAPIRYFTSDLLNNVYTFENYNLVQYNDKGEKLREYNQKKLGKATYLDATNPLNLLVLYGQYATIEILDRNLTLLQTVNFKDLNYTQIKASCLSPDNKIWLYDQEDMKLKHYDFNKTKIHETEDLSLLLGYVPNPAMILCTDRNLYVADPTHGIYVFDLLGAFKKQFYLKGIRNFQIVNNQLIYFKNKQLISFNLNSFDEINFSLPDSTEVKAARVETDRLYLLRKNELTLYAL